VVDYRDAGGARIRLSAANRQQAEDLLAEKIKESKRAPTNREDRDITLAEYTTRWLKAAVGQLAPITYGNYKQHLTLHILPKLGSLRIADLRRRHVKDLLTALRSTMNAHGRPFAKNTLRLIKAALSSVLTDAVDDEILFANPVMQLGRSKKRSATRMTADDVLSRIRPMTWAQAQTFEQALSTLHRDHLLDARYSMLFFVMAKTGMRPGEALALQPGDLDLVKRTMRVERAATMGGQVKSTKTNEVRTVDLSASLISKLVAYRNWLELETMGGRWAETPWLFPNDQGNLYEEPHVRRVFHRILHRANLPRFRVYDLRHSFASLLLSSNVPLLYVSKQLGHANPTTTLRYYARWIPSGDQRYVDVLDTASEKNLAPNVGTSGEKRSEVIDSKPIPSRLTHDDESTTTHPRCARKDSWLTPSPAATRRIVGS
jgi:integrase